MAWTKAAICVLALALVLAGAFGGGTFSQTVAAWAQAIGTVAAIVGAVWLAQGQMRQARAADLAETRAFVQAVRVELSVALAQYRADVGNVIGDPRTTALELALPPRRQVFVIYPASASRLGKIDDEELRQLIVVAYDRADSMLHALHVLHRLSLQVREGSAPESSFATVLSLASPTLRAQIEALTLSLRIAGTAMDDTMKLLERQAAIWERHHGWL
jgi:hypothetical protein